MIVRQSTDGHQIVNPQGPQSKDGRVCATRDVKMCFSFRPWTGSKGVSKVIYENSGPKLLVTQEMKTWFDFDTGRMLV